MKKKALIITLLLLFSLSSGIFAGIFYIRNDAKKNSRNGSTVQAESGVPSPYFKAHKSLATPKNKPEDEPVFVSEQYIVSLSDDKIIIHKVAHDGSIQKIEEKSIDSKSLPREDSEKLYFGIFVDSLKEARELVEDYL